MSEDLSQLVHSLDGSSREDKIKALIEYVDDATALGKKSRSRGVAKENYSAAGEAKSLIYYLEYGKMPENAADKQVLLFKELDRQLANPREPDSRLGTRLDE